MTIRIGVNYKPKTGYTMLLDAVISESYNGSGTTWTNLAGNGNNCTLYNSPSYSLNQQGAGSLLFDGSSMYGATPDLGLGGDFTLISWVKKSNSSSAGYMIGAGWHTATQAINFGVIGLTPNLNSGRQDNPAPVAKASLSAGTIDTTNWHHLCAVRDKSSNTAYIYVNGSLAGSGDFIPEGYYNSGAATTSYIGRSAFSSDSMSYPYVLHFGGYISLVNIYNSTLLSSNEILDNYRQTKSRYGR